jgi:hypothetical protein
MNTVMRASRSGRAGRGTAWAVAIATAVTLVVGFATASVSTPNREAGGSPIVAKTDDGKLKSRVHGTTEDGRRVAGTFTPRSFSVRDGQLVTTGDLSLVVRGHGKPMTETVEDVTFDVVAANAPQIAGSGSRGMMGTSAAPPACDILNLVLGPLDLNLLGLEIHLDTVVLDIVAQSGPGNLLGNLLCTVAGLLDGTPLGGLLPELLGQLGDLLNQILGVLQL